jgi:exodeoxyribonuclease VII large subunit
MNASLFDDNAAGDGPPVLSVSEFTGAVRRSLEGAFPIVYIQGELSNFSRPASGHWYFSLKDSKAQVRCAMFAGRNRLLRFKPQDGMEVLVRGKVSLYEARGDFQIIAEHMAPAGEGALQAAFEALKAKLAAEGLFASERKRPLPAFPRHIAIISSATGAALRDILSVLRRRCPALMVTLLPVPVQGDEAGPQIEAAFARIGRWVATPEEFPRPPPDLVLLARGGGSLEDLWAFNLELVARAIAACPVPVVAGVGHETDVTIADFVADLRAPTPSAAAELVAPDLQAASNQVRRLADSLQAHWQLQLRHRRQQLAALTARLIHPGRALQQQMQRVDDLERQLQLGLQRRLERLTHRLTLARAGLTQHHPQHRIAQLKRDLARNQNQLVQAMQLGLRQCQQQLGAVARALNGVSPLATLDRGYALAMTPPLPGERFGQPLSGVTAVAPGDAISVQLRDGRVDAEVRAVLPDRDTDADAEAGQR